MNTELFPILARSRGSSADFAVAEQFSVGVGQTVRAEILLEETAWTPYSINDEKRCVYFVQCPEDIHLEASPFIYSTQFEHAQRLLSIPYESLLALQPRIKRPEKLILIHSMGRCGSTLMSQILNQVDGVYSLSEPDIFTMMAYLRKEDGSRDEELSQLLGVTSSLLYPQADASVNTLALKFRSNVITLGDLFMRAFPDATNIFMYRNALSWAKSVYRFLVRLNFPVGELYPRGDAIELWTGLTGGEESYVKAYVDDEIEKVYFTDLLVPAWTSYLDRYMQNFERGVNFHCLTYEDLNSKREISLQALFDYCGLDRAGIEKALTAFEKDSQEGTDIARDIEVGNMSDLFISRFLERLAQHPRYNRADFRLPEQSH